MKDFMVYYKFHKQGVTTEYYVRLRCGKPHKADGMLRENTVTHHSMRFGAVSECMGEKTVPSLNFKAVT